MNSFKKFLYALKGTEPPEPEHRKPVTPSSSTDNPDNPNAHEEGEVKVGQVKKALKRKGFD